MSVTKKVPYSKRAFTFDEQANQLIARGMIVEDLTRLLERLRSTNYYRLTGYWYFFREHQGGQRHQGERFRPGTTFDNVWELYEFDSKLRALTLEAIEKLEVAIRTQISYHHAQRFGPFGYADNPAALRLGDRLDSKMKQRVDRRVDFLGELDTSIKRSLDRKDAALEHFYATYSDRWPPIWVASEVMTLGAVLRIFDGSPNDVKSSVAKYFEVPHKLLRSWFLTLNAVRNVCAHHSRLWNRTISITPQVPDYHPQRHRAFERWFKPVEIFPSAQGGGPTHPTTFVVLSICNELLTVACPNSGWAKKLDSLLAAYPNVSRRAMGFPDNWKMSPVWHDC